MIPDSLLDQIRAALPVIEVARKHYKLRKEGQEWIALENKSVAINDKKNVWRDFGSGDDGGDIFQLEMFATKCTFQEAVERLAQTAGIPLPGSRRASSSAAKKMNGSGGPAALQQQRVEKHVTAEYDYTDADEQLIYQVVRLEWIEDGRKKKTFRQRRPVGPLVEDRAQQKWDWKLGDVPHMLFHLPLLREEMAQPPDERRVVFIPEGEKDCETLIAWGCVATTNSGGAANWKEHHAAEFERADVVVILDNDLAGRQRGHAVAASLRGIADRVRVLSWTDHWPECPDHGDVTDWRDQADGDVGKLFEIVERLPDWTPEPPLSSFRATRYIDIDRVERPLLWTIKDILQRASVSLWYGAPSSGKSFLLTDAAMAVARGAMWMNRRTRPGLVIYQTGEGGTGFRLRLKAYRQHFKLQPNDNIPFVYLPVRVNLFADDADVDALVAEIKAWASFYDYGLELVCIDTFNAASSGANENSNTDVARVLERCRRIVEETGAHVAVVHHTPAGGGRPRGHSSLVGDVETTIAVEVLEQVDRTETGGLRFVRRWNLTKQKDGPSSIEHSFVLAQERVGTDEDGDAITSCVVLARDLPPLVPKGDVPPGYAVLPPANVDIFRALLTAIRDHGKTPPANVPGPPNQCVTIAQWQDELLELIVGHEEVTPTVRDRVRKRIQRAAKQWLPEPQGRMNLVVKSGVWVWRTQRRVHGIDAPPARLLPEPDIGIYAPGEARYEDLDG